MVETGKKRRNNTMNLRFLKTLPVIAAMIIAASCSKDDDTNAPEKKQNASPQEKTIIYNPDGTITVPFTVKVNTGKSLTKKMEYSEGEDGEINIEFVVGTNDDEKLRVSGEGVTGELGLKGELDDITMSPVYTFSGNLTLDGVTAADLEKGIELNYEYGTALTEPASSSESLLALVTNCNHLYKGAASSNEENITLTDQNAYLAISMSPCCEHILQFNGEEQQTFTVQDGQIWIAIPSDEDVTIEDITIKKLNDNSSTGNSGDDNSTENSGETNETTFTGFKITKSKDEIAASTIYSIKRQYFSVSSEKKVYFSKGNLQYNSSATNPWRFAEHQWDFIGGSVTVGGNEYTFGTVEECTNNNADGPWIDLFGWGTWLEGYDPKNTSQSGYPSQDAYDKGTTAIGKEWVVLQTNDYNNSVNNEWQYLFERKDLLKNLLLGNATIKIKIKDINDVEKDININGVVVLPDDWVTPDGITFKPGYGNFTKQSYNTEQWAIMEAAGAVFLPNAGQRLVERGQSEVKSFSTVNGPGYWSSTSSDASNVYYYSVTTSQGIPTPVSRYMGKPVRLVRVLN